MKKILFITGMLMATCFVQAQQQQLFENDWYITKISIDNEDFFPPDYDEEIGSRYHTHFENEFFITSGCNSVVGEIDNLNDTDFIITTASITMMGCPYPDYDNYDNIYFNVFSGYENELFQYEVSSDSNGLTLIITNPSGNKVFYGNQFLKTGEYENNNIRVYPNPITDKVTLSNIDSFGKINVRVYDMSGKLLVSKTLSEKKEIDLSHLKSGVYFMHLLNASNEIITTKKLMKK